MKCINKLFVTGILIVFMSSCASVHNGYNSFATSTVLSQANFDYTQKYITGTSTATYILGIGGMKRDALVNDAKQDLMKSISLKSNQALANVTVDFKLEYIFGGIYVRMICTMNADVVEFKNR